MPYEWNDEKAKRNTIRRARSFKTATFAFDDPYAFVMDDEAHSRDEQREWLIGDSGAGILVVVFTRRPGRMIRIISARRATRSERTMYEENKRI